MPQPRSITLAALALAASATLLAAGPAAANSLDVNEFAAICGGGGTACNGSSCGLETILVDQGNAYVQSDHPVEEPRISVKLCFNHNGVTLPPRPNGSPGRFRIMKFYREQGNNPRQHFFLTLKRNQANTQYRLAVLQRNAGGTFELVGEFFWGNGTHELEIIWDKTVGTGRVEVYRDGVLRASRDVDLTGWNVDMVRMGAIDEIDAGVAGSVYYDQYVSTR